ncbi:MAG TPA: hypothetical protein VMD74_01445 [Candidatus Methylomirabilis sp.]|nr:hypothetical protein [Candidatus Methylomirabilis sp.]
MEFGKLNPRGTAKASERLLTYELKIGIDGSRFYCDLKLLKNNLSPWQTSLQNQCPADSLSKSVTVPKK